EATADQTRRDVRAFVSRLRDRTGQHVVLYAGWWLRQTLGVWARHCGCDLLWLAAYTAHPQGYYEPLGFTLDEVPLWQYAGAAAPVDAQLVGFPRETPIGRTDISVELTPGGIDRMRWIDRGADPCEDGPD